LKVKLVDNTVKTVLIDDSETVAEITNVICKKVLINNPEEYSLRVEGRGESTLSKQLLSLFLLRRIANIFKSVLQMSGSTHSRVFTSRMLLRMMC